MCQGYHLCALQLFIAVGAADSTVYVVSETPRQQPQPPARQRGRGGADLILLQHLKRFTKMYLALIRPELIPGPVCYARKDEDRGRGAGLDSGKEKGRNLREDIKGIKDQGWMRLGGEKDVRLECERRGRGKERGWVERERRKEMGR